MSPAFSSAKQAAAFGILLGVILLLPVLVGVKNLPPRDQLYSSVPWGVGAFPYLHDQIFEEKEDIDIAFMGSSPLWWGIDTPYVQEKLSESLGRKAVVRTFGWAWNGFDPFYFIARDLLQRRKVKMIVFCDISQITTNCAHPLAPHWFRFAEDAKDLAGLPFRAKVSFYAAAIVGMPQNLLGLIRNNDRPLPLKEIAWAGFLRATNPATRLGSLAIRMRYYEPFTEHVPEAMIGPQDALVYSEETKDKYEFGTNRVRPLHAAFIRKIGELAKAHQTKLVFLQMPMRSEMRSTKIDVSAYWPDAFGTDVTMLGVPPATLFTGLSDTEVLNMYFDELHFDQNGQKYFAPIITPALIKIYESQTKH